MGLNPNATKEDILARIREAREEKMPARDRTDPYSCGWRAALTGLLLRFDPDFKLPGER